MVNGYKRALEGVWLAVIFLLPLFFNPLSHQIFYLNKALLLQFLVIVMLALTVGDWIYSKSSHRWPRWKDIITSPLHLAILAFGLWVTLATVASITPNISFWGSWARAAGLLTLLCWMLFFLIIAQQIRHRAQLRRAIYALLLSSAMVSVLGILQYYLPDFLYNVHSTFGGRAFSTTGNPLSLSAFLAMVIPLNMAFIVAHWSQRKEGRDTAMLVALCALLVLQFWCLSLAQYSGTILLFVIAPIVFLILLGIIKRKKLLLGLGTICLLALAIMAVLLVVPGLFPSTSIKIPEAEDASPIITSVRLETTLDTRISYWRTASDIVLKSPEVPFSNDALHSLRSFIGYGPETFTAVSQLYFPQEHSTDYTKESLLIDRPHNHYLYLATTVGLIGLAGFIAILATYFYLLFRYLHNATSGFDKLLIIGLMAGMAQYMVDMLFDPSTLSPELVFWLMLGMVPVIGRLTSSDESAKANAREVSNSTRTRFYLSIGCAAMLIVAGIGLTIRPFLADMQLQKGIDLHASHDGSAIFAFNEAVKINPEEAAYWGAQGAYVFDIARMAGEESVKSQLLAFSTASYEQARELDPYIAFHYSSLADVYVYWAQEGATDKWSTALSLYDKAVQLFPDNAVIYNKWALALIIARDFDEAQEKLDYAASIDPDWADTSYFLSGFLLAWEGKGDEAAHKLISRVQENPSTIKHFLELCSELNTYHLVYLLEDTLELYPQEVSADWIPHAMLGITSLFNGSLDKSLSELNTARLLVPDEDTGALFRAILMLSELSPKFKTEFASVASEWRVKLSQSVEGDVLLQALDKLIDTATPH